MKNRDRHYEAIKAFGHLSGIFVLSLLAPTFFDNSDLLSNQIVMSEDNLEEIIVTLTTYEIDYLKKPGSTLTPGPIVVDIDIFLI